MRSIILPSRATTQLQRQSKLLLSFDAGDASLTPRRGSTAIMSRASTGSARDSNGFFRQVGANAPRFDWADVDHDGIGELPELLLEAGSANLLLRSQEFENAAAWTTGGTTISANTATAPDGTATMDSLTEDSSVGFHNVFSTPGIAIANGAVYTFSVWVKANGRTWMALLGDAGGGFLGGAQYFDIGNGVVGALGVGNTRRSITAYANGVYRVSVTATATGVSARPGIYLALADGAASFNGTGSGGIYVWGAQLEQQPVPTSYIATTSAAVPRSADSFYLPYPYTPQPTTLYVKFVEKGSIVAGGGCRVVQIGNASNAAPLLLMYANGSVYNAYHDNGGSVVSTNAAATPNIGDVVELRLVLGANGALSFGQSINGAAEAVTATVANPLATAWSDSRLYLNSIGATSQGLSAFLAVKAMRGVQTLAAMRGAY